MRRYFIFNKKKCRVYAAFGVSQTPMKQEGGKEMLEKLIKKKLEKNLSVEQIAEMLEIDILKVENIIKEIHNEK